MQRERHTWWSRAATVLWLVAMASVVTGVVLGLVVERSGNEAWNLTPRGVLLLQAACFAAYASVGALIVRQARGHTIGWIYLVAGSAFAVGLLGESWAKWHAVDGDVNDLTAIASWVYDWSWRLAASIGFIAVVLFPHRRPTSWWMRVLTGLLVLDAVAVVLPLMVHPGTTDGGSYQENPFAIDATRTWLRQFADAAEAVSWVLIVVTVLSFLVRYARSPRAERIHLRWILGAVLLFAAGLVVSVVGSAAGRSLDVVPFLIAIVVIPAAMTGAILRDRLYDIELIVNKLVVYGCLVAAITAVYGAVVLAGQAVLSGGEPPSAVVTIATLVIVSLGLVPARAALQRFADRVVFGRRSTPYHALASFAEVSAGAWNLDDTAPRLAGLLADATGAAASVVFVRIGDELLPVARIPAPTPLQPVAVADLDVVLAGFDLGRRIERRGELLGAIALRMPPGRPLRAAERRLIDQLAAQAALSFETLRLTSELSLHARALDQQAQELRRSRSRLVQAQDAERIRIGRDLHDGAQQHLLAIIAKVELARGQLRRDVAVAESTMTELQQDTRFALREIRELVHGVCPQILVDRGLAVAVAQRVARLPIEVEVEADDDEFGRRFASSVESAAWFVVCEALNNVLKHAHATRAIVRIRSTERLDIEVVDDGIGLALVSPGHGLTSIGDRVAAVEGSFEITTPPCGGTTVRCSFPLEPSLVS